MENATKALLIAAGILLVVMILSLLVYGYNQMSNYYSAEHDAKTIKQLADFNKVFLNYNREKIRGTEMISLMNRVIDYNERQAYENEKGFPRMRVTIDVSGHTSEFKYELDVRSAIFINKSRDGVITNTRGTDKTEDKNLIDVTTIEEDLINLYKDTLKLNVDKLQKLSSNISNIMIEEKVYKSDEIAKNYVERDKEKRLVLLKSILKDVSQTTIENNIENIKTIACQYYEYTQFKRAYFDCIEMNLDKETGRVSEMNFRIRTTNSGNIEFN